MHEIATFILKNEASVLVRLLDASDSEPLYTYLQNLSPESRSRFGPHSFDKNTVNIICNTPHTDITRYVAEAGGNIIAYMLIKKGMIEEDRQRYAEKTIFFDERDTVTYAPSVADAWQNTGLGSKMFEAIRNELLAKGIKNIILWGGVQETNQRAVHFYTKYGFRLTGSFWHDNKNNLDMVLAI